DGGVFYTYDGGNKWWKADSLPVSQFYHVSVDMDQPYNVYGGLQDNGSWIAPSDGPGGITNDLWQSVFFGDGFWVFVDPSDDADYVYAEAQGGEIGRINRKTHEIRLIKPLPQYQEKKLRCNWNSPIHVGKSGAVYLGCQFLFRTTDHGQSWERISTDLTTNDKAKQQQELSGGITVDNSAAEMHTTIYAIAESPLNAQVVWAGTDDGNLQVTRDGGKTWTNVVANIAGLPKSAWVSYIDAGHFAEGTAYVTFDRHTFGDITPYAYKTSDFGKTWKRLVAADAPVKGYAHVVREDLVKEDLLFLGTELGLWVSLDGGKQWAQYLGGNFPHVAVRDLAVHPRDHDLVIATHGRGIWIVDDISPLRALTPDVMTQEAAFVGISPAVQRLPSFDFSVQGDAKYIGPGESNDAVITYYQRRRHIFGDLTIDVRDSSGKVVAVIPSSKRRGLNRVAWSMRMEAPKAPPAATAGVTVGPRYLPGTYTVTMTKDKNTYTTPIEAVSDPRSKHSAADRQAQFALALDVYQQFAEMTYVVEKINGVRLALDDRAGKLPAGDALAKRLRTASAAADELRKKIVATKEGGMITGEERLREFLTDLYFGVVFHEGNPTQAQTDRAASLKRELGDVGNDFDAWAKKELPGINAELAKKGLPPVEALQREAWEAEQKATGGGG
ncbi:MAG TPA: sialidase, partial [Thermoanaerobaculia bacterium]|nr:sialidase [Thermoanaerobaculia bacterium]